jgi:hypothetical protein
MVARGASRRQVLKGLAGGAIAGGVLGATRFAPHAAAQDDTCVGAGDDCTSGTECCSGLCSDSGVCYCEDPDRPVVGCDCDTGTQDACGGGTEICCATTSTPGGPGVCTSSSVGCNPTGECAGAGDSCSTNDDCCAGSCSADGICYCEDPDRPALGCPCTTGTESACGDSTLVCCSTGGDPGAEGVCTSGSVGCNPTGDDDDTVPVTTLPGTGIGPSGGTSAAGRLGPLALLTGGAAVAWRLLRGKPSTTE